jgi:hypothetical protein
MSDRVPYYVASFKRDAERYEYQFPGYRAMVARLKELVLADPAPTMPAKRRRNLGENGRSLASIE